MKCFAPILTAMIVAQVNANGVCYDPDHGYAAGTMTAQTVKDDIAIIKSHGFNSVRTYISKFGNTNFGQAIAEAGFNMTVALGVPYPQSDYVEQKDAAITAANTGGVEYIFVGNENLAGATNVPPDMIDTIKSIKSLVPGNVKVGTVQRNTEVINYAGIYGWSDLVASCDVIGVNVHPYFTPGTTADNAIDVVNNQWTIMKANFGDKLIVTETGWPSDGTLLGNTGSVDGTRTFYNDYKAWSSSMPESFYFQIFDTPYKATPVEKSFGLLTPDSTPKFDLSQSAGTVHS